MSVHLIGVIKWALGKQSLSLRSQSIPDAGEAIGMLPLLARHRGTSADQTMVDDRPEHQGVRRASLPDLNAAEQVVSGCDVLSFDGCRDRRRKSQR